MLKVRKQAGSKQFEIFNSTTGKVVEGGFFSKSRAEDYMNENYDTVTGEPCDSHYTGR